MNDDWIILAEATLAGLLVIFLAWVFWPGDVPEPLQTAVTITLEDGQVLTLCFDRRGHLARVVHRERSITD